VVKLTPLGTKTNLDAAQALTVGQLDKCHNKILIKTTKKLYISLILVTSHPLPKDVQRQENHDHLAGKYKERESMLELV